MKRLLFILVCIFSFGVTFANTPGDTCEFGGANCGYPNSGLECVGASAGVSGTCQTICDGDGVCETGESIDYCSDCYHDEYQCQSSGEWVKINDNAGQNITYNPNTSYDVNSPSVINNTFPPNTNCNVCGDYEVDSSEDCDGALGCSAGYQCNSTCTSCVDVCGNGNVDPGEICDETASSTGCNALQYCSTGCDYCVFYCGDGIQNNGEECDYNDVNTCGTGEECANSCTCVPSPVCGNGTVETGEECDEGANNGPTGNCSINCEDQFKRCSPGAAQCIVTTSPSGISCTSNADCPVCGNGTVETGEECDDGNTSSDDGCSSSCQDEFLRCQNNGTCGYSTSAGGDVCSTNGSTNECPVCGNGVLEGSEECDDGNTSNADGCSSSCLDETPGCYIDITPYPNSSIEIGDTVTATCYASYVSSPTYEMAYDNGAFSTTQSITRQNIQAGSHEFECEVSNSSGVTGYCQRFLFMGSCNDGIIQPGEQCEFSTFTGDEFYAQNVPSALQTPGNCSSTTCLVQGTCGDGYVDGSGTYSTNPEVCDDGADNGTGGFCNSTCDGYEPSVCGNGLLDVGEQCDDGKHCWDGVVGPGGIYTACNNDSECTGVGDELCSVRNGEPKTCWDGGNIYTGCDDASECVGIGDGTCVQRTQMSCDSNCTNTSCTNGIVTYGEECDDGNTDNNDSCSNVCEGAQCGDHIVQVSEGEICDDGNNVNGDFCTADCSYCGLHCGDCSAKIPNLDIVFVVDRSESMNGGEGTCLQGLCKLKNAQDAVNLFVDALNPAEDRVALFSYADNSTYDFALGNNFDAMKSSVNALVGSGGTNIGGAIELIETKIAGELSDSVYLGRAPFIIFLTDGDPTVDPTGNNDPYTYVENTIASFKDHFANIPIFTIGFDMETFPLGQDLLKNHIATSPSYYYEANAGTAGAVCGFSSLGGPGVAGVGANGVAGGVQGVIEDVYGKIWTNNMCSCSAPIPTGGQDCSETGGGGSTGTCSGDPAISCSVDEDCDEARAGTCVPSGGEGGGSGVGGGGEGGGSGVGGGGEGGSGTGTGYCALKNEVSCNDDDDCGFEGPCLQTTSQYCGGRAFYECSDPEERDELCTECGNGILNEGEECDLGVNNGTGICDPLCKLTTRCGDGIVQSCEQCDDGNTEDGDGCNSECILTDPLCGDGIVYDCEEQTVGGNLPGQEGVCSDNLGIKCFEDTDCTGGVCLEATYCAFQGTEGHVCEGDPSISCAGDNECPSGNCLGIIGNTNKPGSGNDVTCGQIEECDDGNSDSYDGCSSSCEIEVLACDDTFYDNGGPTNNYSNNYIQSWTICPDVSNTGVISIDFTQFVMENNATCAADSLTVYNGVNENHPLLGTYCGSANPGVISSTDSTGCLYLEFVSDASVNFPGWEADVTCNPLSSGDGECFPYVSTYEAQPATLTANACTVGDYFDTPDSAANWRWDCEGTDGGIDAHCSAAKSYCGDGVCTAAFGEDCRTCPGDCGSCDTPLCVEYLTQSTTQPAIDLATACSAGSSTFSDVPDSATAWRWSCTSTDNVTTVVCESPKDLGTCGNGTVDLGEECDDGNSVNNDACTNACALARCGDGIVENGVEECDRVDGCTSTCEWVLPSCSLVPDSSTTLLGGTVDFTLSYTEQVVGASEFACGGATVCGDGFIDYDGADNILGNSDDEECDDGNTNSDDGCSSSCAFDTPAPGNGLKNDCFNGIQDTGLGETGIDCGGSCQAC